MKKYLMTLAAVLCCAMASTVLTACGGDDDNDNTSKTDTTTPKKVSFRFYYYNTTDMLKYCNVELSYDDGKGNKKTVALTEDMGGNQYIDLSSELPATFKFTRKVTLKQDISSLEKFDYDNRYASSYDLYNAQGNKINSVDKTITGIYGTPQGSDKVAKFAESVSKGFLDYEKTFTFNAKGELVAN